MLPSVASWVAEPPQVGGPRVYLMYLAAPRSKLTKVPTLYGLSHGLGRQSLVEA